MFNNYDRIILSNLINLYETKTKSSKKDRKFLSTKGEKNNKELQMISNFIADYASSYYEGLDKAYHIPIYEIKKIVNISFIFNEREDILELLIQLYKYLDESIQETEIEIIKNGLLKRKDSIKTYIEIFNNKPIYTVLSNKDKIKEH